MTEDKKKLFQFIGGGIIITCAFAIMMPGLVEYMMGLWRIFLLIAIIVVTTVVLVVIYHRFFARKRSADNPTDNVDNQK